MSFLYISSNKEQAMCLEAEYILKQHVRTGTLAEMRAHLLKMITCGTGGGSDIS